MRRKKKNANKSINLQVLPLVHPNAAGIDVGAKEHVVAVPCDRDPKPLRTFQAFTPDLHELAAWLKRCGIETVALERRGAIRSEVPPRARANGGVTLQNDVLHGVRLLTAGVVDSTQPAYAGTG